MAKGRCLSEENSETRTPPEVLPAAKVQQEAPAHVLNTVKLNLATMKRLWPLIQCGCTDEVLKALRWYNILLPCVFLILSGWNFFFIELIILHMIFS